MEETAVQSPGFFDPTLFLLIGMLAIVYFMLIRPQNKRAKELQQMLGALEKGDEVVAASGICLLYTSPSPRDRFLSRMPSSA